MGDYWVYIKTFCGVLGFGFKESYKHQNPLVEECSLKLRVGIREMDPYSEVLTVPKPRIPEH